MCSSRWHRKAAALAVYKGSILVHCPIDAAVRADYYIVNSLHSTLSNFVQDGLHLASHLMILLMIRCVEVIHFPSRFLVQDASQQTSHLMIIIMIRCAKVLYTFRHDFSCKMFHIWLHISWSYSWLGVRKCYTFRHNFSCKMLHSRFHTSWS